MPNESSASGDRRLTIIGAGLAGAVLAALLARRGWQVEVHEMRGDPRRQGYERGRSINLALAERGRGALREAGADGAVMAQAIMMRGRMVHFDDGRVDLQRYGLDDSEVIWSVHRGRLNQALLDIAERAGARLYFDRKLESVDFEAKTATFSDAGGTHEAAFSTLVGADGAGSAVRREMARATSLGERTRMLGHSYKELEIPPTADGGFRIEKNALHIWPRGRFMCIALPNTEGTFTVTLFMPNEGDPAADVPGFDRVRDGAQARALFQRRFPDASPLIPRLEHDFEHNPTGSLGTLYLDRWHLDGRAVLVGDAAHAMVPFHGQGMNCAFEDCAALARHLDAAGDDPARALAAYQDERLPNARAIQHMALENYLEMRDRVDDADYLLQRALEIRLAHRHPDRFVPRYSMVTFRHLPYALALMRGNLQRELLVELTAGLESLEQLDWDRADALVHERLAPLPSGRVPERAGS
ncbi:FAD-dependent monooxygenase [Lysobacter sp. GX 14042]|uniref:FAD-dependent oxidoreductase n=1 Tax=Lysobacter sp. GX 14042 TaxID=2907155 RepID=UPI001F3C6B5C|nr:FAD-dependent monooxygenase [Lysobacter sp. GX 14042]